LPPGLCSGTGLGAEYLVGHKQVVKLLLDKGADVNAQGVYYGNAPQAASFRGREAAVKMLLDRAPTFTRRMESTATHSRRP
jgi:ankyrin repeat protein